MPTRTREHLPATLNGVRTYDIDPARSQVGFRIGYFGIGSVAGAFDRCEGTVRFDPEDLAALSVEARIEAESIDTGNRERDRKLRSANLFDTQQHPHLLFHSTAARPPGDDTFELAGDLTVRGITRNVVLSARFDGFEGDPEGEEAAVFSAEVTLLRSDYEVRWGQVLEAAGALVGDRVDVELSVCAIPRATG